MKIYLTHTSQFDFQQLLYHPIQKSSLSKQHQFFFPHEKQLAVVNSKNIILQSDVVLAEVSHPSTGQGIELGWANMMGKPIFCFYQKGNTCSSSLMIVSDFFRAYENTDEMLQIIEGIVGSND